ncbi:MAG: class I SAM-dependent methyltransferase [Longimicrobiales bacterium]
MIKEIRTRTAYEVADRYDEQYFADLAERYRKRTRFARQRLRNVFSMMPPLAGTTVVDLGCGMGTFTIEATRAGAHAVGIDMVAAALVAAARVAAAEGVPAHFVRGDAADLPFDEAVADVVIAADLTEHLDERTLRRVLAEARRVLRTGGQLIVYTPERAHLFEQLRERDILHDGDPSHIGLRTADELVAAVRAAGLVPQSVRFLPSHLPGWNVLERVLSRWVPLLRRRIGLVARVEAQ